MNATNDEGLRVLLNTEEAAKLWGISRWRIYTLVREGKIRPIIGMGKGWKFLPDDLKATILERL